MLRGMLFLKGGDLIVPQTSSSGAIYLGTLKLAQDEKLLIENNITSVLSVINTDQFFYSERITHLLFYIEDEEEEDISKCFDETFEWIEGQRERGNVLIHCHAGVSRSATVLIAYLMRKEGVGLKEADGMVRKRREIIRPNKGFVEQLKVYERRLGRREGDGDEVKKRNWVAPWERK